MDHLLIHCKFANTCGVKFFDIWDLVGHAEESCFSSFCIEELVGETSFKSLEYGTSFFNVINMERMQ